MNVETFTCANLYRQNILITMSKMFRLVAWLLVTSAVLGFQTVQGAAPGGPSDRDVQPIYYDGNLTCSDLLPGVQDLTELKVEPGADGTYGDGVLEVVVNVQEGAKTFSWDQGTSPIRMMAVFVKGGPGGNLYRYLADGLFVTSDSGLHSPINPNNGKFYGLSHISFCYIPGVPEIEITKTCPTAVIVPSGDAIEYTYQLEVENTGNVPLYDIVTTDDTALAIDPTGEHQFYTTVLEPGGIVTFTNTFITSENGIRNEASVKAAVETGGEPTVIDDSFEDCPQLSPPGSMDLDKECDTVVVNASGVYGLQVNYRGSVCNTSEVVINNVTVFEEHDGIIEPHFIGTLAPLGYPDDLRCADFDGSYEPVPGATEPLPSPGDQIRAFSDTVRATGVTFFGEPVNTMEYPATCKLCPDCPDCCELCPECPACQQ